MQERINEELNRMMKLDVIEPASSPWSNPVVCVTKASGKLRLCLDARKLNSVTVKESYPLPYITRILGRLEGTKYLSSIDLSDAFWQIPLQKESRPKTAFIVPGRGLFQFKRMPFGLCNAAQSLCRLMDNVLGYDLEPAVFVYLDDIVVATSSLEDHFDKLKKVAERLTKAGLTINLEKSKFCVKKLKYLGFVVDADGLHTDPDKIRVILEMPSPKCLKEVRRVLGMSGWYRRFINNYATITAPITSLLKKGGKRFKWTPEAEKAFQELKEKLTTAPVLATPDYHQQFIVQCDASDVGVGAVLLQGEGDDERVIAFMAQKLTGAQSRYSTTEKECLAVILAVEKFRGYYQGVEFKIITDHSSLLWLETMQNPSGRLWRWAMRLQHFNYIIEHRKGKDNIVADVLSRAVEAFEIIDGDTREPNNDWYAILWKSAQENEDMSRDYKIEQGKLFKHCLSRRKYGLRSPKWKLVVPPESKINVLQQCHDNPTAAHFGYHKTLNRIAGEYFWPRMSDDVRRYVKECEVCKASKPANKIPNPPLGNQKLAKCPWEMISLDYVGPYPRTKDGNTTILVITDWFSKYVIARPLRKADAKSLVRILEREVFLVYGVPKTLWTDNGKQIISRQMQDLLSKYNVTHVRTPLYSPQSNPTERVNKVLISSIRAYITKDQREWDKYVPHVVCAINTAEHESTKYSPYFVNFGKSMLMSGESPLGSVGEVQNQRATDWEDQLKRARQEVDKNLKKAYEREAKYYNLRSRPEVFEPGELAWRKNFTLSDASKTIASKLLPKYIKTKIISRNGNAYEVEDVDSKKSGTYDVKHLKKN